MLAYKDDILHFSDDQKIALLGYLLGALQGNKEFERALLEGISVLHDVKFDEHGLPINTTLLS